MKNIIYILILITLSSCMKQIDGEITFKVQNDVKDISESPCNKGITISYMDNGELIEYYCKDVGKIFKIKTESGNQLYIKGVADQNNYVSIIVWYNDQELYNIMEFEEAVIDVTL